MKHQISKMRSPEGQVDKVSLLFWVSTHVQCWHHKSWTVSEIPSNAEIPGCPGIVRPNCPHHTLLTCQNSIPDSHCYSDRPWLSRDGQPNGTPFRLSLTVVYGPAKTLWSWALRRT